MKKAIIKFSKVPETLNIFGLVDYVENITSITDAIIVLQKYYTTSEIESISSIEIVTY